MKIFVNVKPGARHSEVRQIADNQYFVSVTARAQDNKANKAALEVMAAHLRIPKSALRMVSGARSRTKVFEIRI